MLSSLTGKITLQGVDHDVGAAAGSLVGRQSIGKLRVKQREFGIAVIGGETTLEHALVLGNYGGIAHFAACCSNGKHHADGSAASDGLFALIIIPDIALVGQTIANTLGAVDNAAPAHGQDEIHALGPAQLHTFLDFAQEGIGNHATQQHVV